MWLLFSLSRSIVVSVRDVLTWVEFMNTTESRLNPAQGFYHGAHLVFLDALGCGSSLGGPDMKESSARHIRTLMDKCGEEGLESMAEVGVFCSTDTHCGIQPFMISTGTAHGTMSAIDIEDMSSSPKKTGSSIISSCSFAVTHFCLSNAAHLTAIAYLTALAYLIAVAYLTQ